MYKKVAIRLTDIFINKQMISRDKRDICEYGFEMLISTIAYMLIFFVVAIITDTFIESLMFWLGLFVIRKTAGGHHAKSYSSCHLLFAFNHVLFIVATKVLPQAFVFGSVCLLLSFAITTVAICAPVDHKNKPFVKNEYIRYKKLSQGYCAILLAILVSIITIHITNRLTEIGEILYFSFSFGTASATVSLLSAKIIRNKERGTNK